MVSNTAHGTTWRPPFHPVNKVMNISLHILMAGLVCVSWKTRQWEYALHLVVWRPRYWRIGRGESWCNGPIIEYGAGPIALLVKL